MTEPIKPNYRVRIAIYDANEQTPEDAEMWTDEPLYGGEAASGEMATQALRTHRYFENKLTKKEV
jgi:hypothetical protein